MSKRLDIGLDIETLAASKSGDEYGPVQTKAKIIQIGVTVFDPFQVSTFDYLLANSFGYNIMHTVGQEDRVECPVTIDWWRKQDPKVWDSITANQITLREALEGIIERVSPVANRDTCLWARGDVFDLGIIQDAFYSNNLVLPIPFWNIRDIRSIGDICFTKESDREFRKTYTFGKLHDAVADSISQARYVQECFDRTKYIRK